MKTQNFTGYRVPKTLNFNDITVFEDIIISKKDKLKLFKEDKYYYVFYNNTLNNYAIPQLCNLVNNNKLSEKQLLLEKDLKKKKDLAESIVKNTKEVKSLKKFLNYLKSDMTESEIIKEIFIMTEQKFLLERLVTQKERINDINYDKLEKSGKFIIKTTLQPA